MSSFSTTPPLPPTTHRHRSLAPPHSPHSNPALTHQPHPQERHLIPTMPRRPSSPPPDPPSSSGYSTDDVSGQAARLRLPPSLKALIALPSARGAALPAPPVARTHAILDRIRTQGERGGIGRDTWISLSTATLFTVNSPDSICQLYDYATDGNELAGKIDAAAVSKSEDGRWGSRGEGRGGPRLATATVTVDKNDRRHPLADIPVAFGLRPKPNYDNELTFYPDHARDRPQVHFIRRRELTSKTDEMRSLGVRVILTVVQVPRVSCESSERRRAGAQRQRPALARYGLLTRSRRSTTSMLCARTSRRRSSTVSPRRL